MVEAKIEKENDTEAQIKVESNNRFLSTPKPPFPSPGSTIGRDGRYFCLGMLGRGTFCSIHKCIDLSFSHTLGDGSENVNNVHGNSTNTNGFQTKPKLRVVVAKVEVSNFAILDGEASILSFLSDSLSDSTVPLFVEYIKYENLAEAASTNPPTTSYNDIGFTPISNIVTPSDGSSSSCVSAIIMEYLPGEDMHALRDRHCQAVTLAATKTPPDPKFSKYLGLINASSRKVSVRDAVYLCADVMLPLVKNIHNMGIVHRDLKPSNCVRVGTPEGQRSFRLIDFGLSKSFVVPGDSSLADETKPWNRDTWLVPPSLQIKINQQNSARDANVVHQNNGSITGNPVPNAVPKGYIRKERPDADFRGTSMYASLRVHQARDFSRRDDLWSLMYVFCDLVSGGLPWMSYAAARDRKMCQKMKEWVHGERQSIFDEGETATSEGSNDQNQNNNEGGIQDRVDELLKGAEYHIHRHKRETADKSSRSSKTIAVVPLPLSQDQQNVGSLRTIFRHLSSLQYADDPDYELIERCMRNFSPPADQYTEADDFPNIDWDLLWPKENIEKRMCGRSGKVGDENPTESLYQSSIYAVTETNDIYALDEAAIHDAEKERQTMATNDVDSGKETTKLSAEVADLSRLPLELQLQLAQVEYNACNPMSIPCHLARRDWLALAKRLAFEPWDTTKYERGDHRTPDDGYRREVYMSVIQRCFDAAQPFENFFISYDDWSAESWSGWDDVLEWPMKRRRINKVVRLEDMSYEYSVSRANSDFLLYSKVKFALHAILDSEKEKKIAPPPAISFGKSLGIKASM